MPESAAPVTVLVVEDESLLLFAIGDDLREAGFEVVEAGNADQAARLLSDNPAIRVVFSDIDMPGSLDGVGLCGLVRQRWPQVRFILTSGKRRPTAADMADVPFIAKPYAPSAVAAAIRSALD